MGAIKNILGLGKEEQTGDIAKVISPVNNLDKLYKVRTLLTEVYSNLATDNLPDNGNLSILNDAILSVNISIQYLVGLEKKKE